MKVISMNPLSSLRNQIKDSANRDKKFILERFFKTKKGEYAEGDVFLGITVPIQRKIAKEYQFINLPDLQKLIRSKIHEERLITLLILILKFKKGIEKEKKEIYDFYLRNTKYINNWDLVDLSAPNIVGAYLLDKDRNILLKLAKSKLLWERRISILATFSFIKNQEIDWTIEISEILLTDKHDLIQKAVGWMLRELGKRVSELELKKFLDKNTLKMPRTMLRYAIERFEEKDRKYYLELKQLK